MISRSEYISSIRSSFFGTATDLRILQYRIKKLGGLGWKAKLVVGWALDREVADGIEIVDKLDNHHVLVRIRTVQRFSLSERHKSMMFETLADLCYSSFLDSNGSPR